MRLSEITYVARGTLPAHLRLRSEAIASDRASDGQRVFFTLEGKFAKPCSVVRRWQQWRECQEGVLQKPSGQSV